MWWKRGCEEKEAPTVQLITPLAFVWWSNSWKRTRGAQFGWGRSHCGKHGGPYWSMRSPTNQGLREYATTWLIWPWHAFHWINYVWAWVSAFMKHFMRLRFDIQFGVGAISLAIIRISNLRVIVERWHVVGHQQNCLFLKISIGGRCHTSMASSFSSDVVPHWRL